MGALPSGPDEFEEWEAVLADERAKQSTDPADNPAGCCMEGARIGIISNQDPDAEHDRGRPYVSVAVCASEVCQQQTKGRVATDTGEIAYLFEDARRRAVKRMSSG